MQDSAMFKIIINDISLSRLETALAALEDVKKTKTEKGCAYRLVFLWYILSPNGLLLFSFSFLYH